MSFCSSIELQNRLRYYGLSWNKIYKTMVEWRHKGGDHNW